MIRDWKEQELHGEGPQESRSVGATGSTVKKDQRKVNVEPWGFKGSQASA